jgi:AcrR family transcriptional regulator
VATNDRRQREKEARRESILAASKRLFVEKGYNSTTMEEIAELAELSKGAVYYYFSSKNDILGHLICEHMKMLQEMFEESLAELESPEEKLTALTGTFLRFTLGEIHSQNTSFLLQSDFNTADMSEPLQAEMTATLAKVFGYVRETVNQGKETGVFRLDLEPDKMALAIWGAAMGIHAISVKLSPHIIPEFAEDVFNEILKIIPKGLVK